MMTRSTLALAVLLPALSLAAPGCDKGDPVGTSDEEIETESEGDTESDTDSESDSEGDTDSGSDSEGDSEGESEGDTEDEPEPEPEPAPEPAIPCDETPSQECEVGTSFCVQVGDEEIWTECAADPVCVPGDSWEDLGCWGGYCAWDGEKLVDYTWEVDDCNTPLVVNFDDAPLRFEAASAASFDINGVGECTSTDWPTLPWLALDRDGDGVIRSGRELFGSGSVLSSGARASHGFEALAELDADGDGKITAADPAFAELVLWSDHDDNRRGDLRELVPVAQLDLIAIDLNFDRRVECDARGNCGAERSVFEFRDAVGTVRSGSIVDVYLPCQ